MCAWGLEAVARGCAEVEPSSHVWFVSSDPLPQAAECGLREEGCRLDSRACCACMFGVCVHLHGVMYSRACVVDRLACACACALVREQLLPVAQPVAEARQAQKEQTQRQARRARQQRGAPHEAAPRACRQQGQRPGAALPPRPHAPPISRTRPRPAARQG